MRSNNRFNGSDEDEDNETGWQDSYSDLMTDLLAIFVILFAFAMMSQAIQIQRTREVSIQSSNEKVFDSDMLPGEESVLSSNNDTVPDEESFNKLYEAIKTHIEENGLSDQLKVTKVSEEQILLRVSDSVFFDTGRADIHTEAEPLLNRISEMFIMYKDSIKMIRIEGHTDIRPIKSKQFDSNWELSTTRAVNVLRRLLEITELEPKQFSAVGYGENYPIADNNTEEGMHKNRRVDFFIESSVE
jgi:chemotaxis protein MotB